MPSARRIGPGTSIGGPTDHASVRAYTRILGAAHGPLRSRLERDGVGDAPAAVPKIVEAPSITGGGDLLTRVAPDNAHLEDVIQKPRHGGGGGDPVGQVAHRPQGHPRRRDRRLGPHGSPLELFWDFRSPLAARA
ncbi:hypothetical protein [Streptomyces brasiliscabiei]|uniref:hypothetical protein n=1 Tax=Streptomyces brasiliscabiei TaxID=2736302 RepID=UPI0027DF78B6|nr:hypothetical protein [Streptomyces brasiliscabiei]